MSDLAAWTKWEVLLCPAAHEEFDRKGVIVVCAQRRDHVCNGERTPHRFKCWIDDADGKHVEFESTVPHCSSCMSDEEFGYSVGDYCCCAHSDGPQEVKP